MKEKPQKAGIENIDKYIKLSVISSTGEGAPGSLLPGTPTGPDLPDTIRN